MRRDGGAERVSALLLAAVWTLEIARVAHESAALRTVGTFCLGVFVVLAWFRASRHIRAAFLVVFAVSATLALRHAAPALLVEGLARALALGAFFPAVMVLRATVEESPRLARLRDAVKGLEPSAVETWTLHGSHGLAGVINVGASAVLAPVVTPGADEARRTRLASASARGVAIAAMWSPFYVSIAFTSQLVPGTAIWQVMLVGWGAAAIGLALSHFWFAAGRGSLPATLARLRALAIPTAVIVGMVVGATLAFRWSGLLAVAIVVPALCFAYAATLGAGKVRRVLREAFVQTGRVSNELLIVIGGTLLGSVVAALPAVRELGASVTPQMISGPAVIAAFVALVVALGQVGLHPMIAGSVVIPIVSVGNFGVCPLIAVAAGVFAWGLNATTSIWTMPMAMAASTFSIPVGRLVTRRGVGYMLVFGALGVAYLATVNHWLCAA